MRKLTVLLGGVRSGKSAAAVDLAAATGLPVTFIATAQPRDAEMQTRIDRHRLERPGHWRTSEAPENVGDTMLGVAAGNAIIVDCLTVWVSNLLLRLEGGPAEEAEAELMSQLDALVAALAGGDGPVFVVTNEVGMGVVPPYPLGRRFRDMLGTANRRLAAVADQVILMVAGIPVPITQFRAAAGLVDRAGGQGG